MCDRKMQRQLQTRKRPWLLCKPIAPLTQQKLPIVILGSFFA
ncbi:hypothetical protein AB4Z50_09970 [Paenibacillus sp. 2TAB26]